MKHFHFMNFAFAILILASLPSVAEDSLSKESSSTLILSEKTLMERVFERFPGLKLLEQEVKQAEYEVTAAQGGFDFLAQAELRRNTGTYQNNELDIAFVKPTSIFGLNLSAGYRNGTGEFPVYDGKRRTTDSGEWRLGAELPLLRGFQIDSRRASLLSSEVRLKARKNSARMSEIDVLRQALHRYWDWSLAYYRVKIQEELLEIALKRDEWLDARVKAGDIARFERDDNKRTILQRQSLLKQSQQQLVQSTQELLYFLNDSGSEQPSELKPQVNLLESPRFNFSTLLSLKMDELLKIAFNQRPDLFTIQNEIENSQVEVDLNTNRLLPKLDVKSSVSKDINPVGNAGIPTDQWDVALNLEIPIQRRSLDGALGISKQRKIRLETQATLLKRRIEADLRSLSQSFHLALNRIELAEGEYELAHRLEQGELTRFKQGDSNVLTLNLREQATAEARIRKIEARVESLKFSVSLLTSLGTIPEPVFTQNH